MHEALNIFCKLLGSKIKGDKSKALRVSENNTPDWCPVCGFEWESKGTVVRYLGCQIGMDIMAEAQTAPLLTII